MITGILLSGVFLLFSLTSGQKSRTEVDPLSTLPEGAKEFSVYSDPKARYWEISRDTTGLSLFPTILTARYGPSGLTFTERHYYCSAHQYREIKEGPSISEMQSAGDATFHPLVHGSISDIIGHRLCGKNMPY